MLTKKAKYGLKAMLYLSRLDFGQSAFVASIAAYNGTPKKFLDTILGELRTAGMLSSKKGRNGGYVLARRPEHITIGAILRVLDGPLAPIACASRSNYAPCADCQTVETCEIRIVMLNVLARRPEHITIGAILRVLDGPLAPIACASRSNYAPCADCQTVETCEIRIVMLNVREALAGILDHTTLAEVRDSTSDRMASFVYDI